MTYQESLKWQKKEKDFLDTKNLKPFFKSDRSIHEIMDDIEEAFDDYTEESLIFNYMDSYEFMDYISQRYPDIKFYSYEECRVR